MLVFICLYLILNHQAADDRAKFPKKIKHFISEIYLFLHWKWENITVALHYQEITHT